MYDGLGKLIAEYSTDGPPQNPMVHYTATDPLGSPRVLTNENGEIISRRDFMPFGEEIAPDTTYRTAALKYGVGDNVRQKFTGYQHDDETGLDFAEARYYYNNHGRLTAVDPLLASGQSSDPQTFNRYVYTMNRPLVLTDPLGLQSGTKPKIEEPKIKVNIDLPPAEVYVNKKVGDKYYTGVGSIGTITVTDGNGRPIKDAQVTEANVCISGNCGKIGESTEVSKTDSKGQFTDIVGKGEVTTSELNESERPDEKELKEQANASGEKLNSVSEQTLTIKTPEGGAYTAVSRRTITNVSTEEKEKQKALNLEVRATPYVVKEETPAPKIFLKPIN